MDYVSRFSQGFGMHVLEVLSYPLSPQQRIFVLYIVSSFVFAAAVYVWSGQLRQDRQDGHGCVQGLFRFLFPSSVWGNPSAWVDVRYFIPHQIVRLWIYTDFMGAFIIGSHALSLAGTAGADGCRLALYRTSQRRDVDGHVRTGSVPVP